MKLVKFALTPPIAAISVALLAATSFGGMKYSTTLTVGGYTGEETLEGFPLLVRVPATVAKKCQSDGRDIVFTSADGATTFAHEIDEWDASGESLVWVRIPALTAGMKFTMKFGDNAATASTENPAAVWSDYVGVYHMNETANIGTLAFTQADSTANGLDLSVYSGATRVSYMASVEGKVGRAIQNDTTLTWSKSNALVNNDYAKWNVGDNFTVSGWFYFINKGNTRYLVGRKSRCNSTDGGWLVDTSDSGLRISGSTTYQDLSSTAVISGGGVWLYASVAYNGQDVTI